MRREFGPTAEVVGSYEGNARADEIGGEVRPNHGRAQFLRWELLGARNGQPNGLDWEGEVRLNFLARVNQPLRDIHHGIPLYNQSREVICTTPLQGLNFEPRAYHLT